MIKSLIELGTMGHYPLFCEEWLERAIHGKNSLNRNEKLKAKEIFKKLEQHRTVEGQKAFITELIDEERIIFVRAFIRIVEGKIIDKRLPLQ